MNHTQTDFSILDLYRSFIQSQRTAIEPFVLTQLSSKEETESVLNLLQNLLEDRLLHICENTLLAHYVVAEKKLPQLTVAEKLKAYCQLLTQESVQTYFKETYPVMESLVKDIARQWRLQSLLFIQRLHEDEASICERFCDGKPWGTLVELRMGLGDLHRDGASVSYIRFSNGLKLIYKPRSQNLHVHYIEASQWLEQLCNYRLKHPEILACGTHAWVEFIEQHDCGNKSEMERFYEYSGFQTALLYALGASDFHYENLIAHGMYPVLIDVETLFSPSFPNQHRMASNPLNNSVLSTGLFPVEYSDTLDDSNDTSGLLASGGQKERHAAMRFIVDSSGNLASKRMRYSTNTTKNLPHLHGVPHTLDASYLPSFFQGFTNAYRCLMDHKAFWKKQLLRFKNDEIRILFRNTSTYAHLLTEGKHPDFLKQPEDRQRLFQWLDYIAKSEPNVLLFSPYEKKDLNRLNIPFFHGFADSCDVWHEEVCMQRNFFASSGIQTAIDLADALSEHDLKRQCWIVETSIQLNESRQFDMPLSRPESLEQNLFLKTAEIIGDHLIKKALDLEHELSWMVVQTKTLDGRTKTMIPAGFDLYGGMPGDIIALRLLASLSQQARYRCAADKALRYLIRMVDQSFDAVSESGLFSGMGGLIYLCAHLYKAENEEAYLCLAKSWLLRYDPLQKIHSEINHGLVTGTAGLIVALLLMHEVSKEAYYLDLADRLGATLLRKAQHSDRFIKWKGFSKQPLAGMAHGASGFAVCYARLYQYTKNTKYKQAVRKILRYENNLYNPSEQNWPDLRDFVVEMAHGNTTYSTAWSHGAPGIGLARLEVLRTGIDYRMLRKDVDTSLETCLQKGFSHGHNLCFGAFGNLELLLSASERLKQPDWMQQARDIGRDLLTNGFERGFQLDHPTSCPAGLMNGLTGIMYQCLRLHAPDKTPSILSLNV